MEPRTKPGRISRSGGYRLGSIPIESFTAPESLRVTQIFLCRLNRDMCRQELNLLRSYNWEVLHIVSGRTTHGCPGSN